MVALRRSMNSSELKAYLAEDSTLVELVEKMDPYVDSDALLDAVKEGGAKPASIQEHFPGAAPGLVGAFARKLSKVVANEQQMEQGFQQAEIARQSSGGAPKNDMMQRGLSMGMDLASRMKPKETEPLTTFGPVLKIIRGDNAGGVSNSCTLYERGAEVISAKSYKGLFGPQGVITYCKHCCPQSQTRKMIPKYRFMGVHVEETSKCLGFLGTSKEIMFELTNDEFESFSTGEDLTNEELNAMFDFVYGAIDSSGMAEKMHSLAHLTVDKIIERPHAEVEISM